MENAHTDYNDRLRAHGERLLKALDAQAMPETYADILRAARALIAIKKALDLIHKAEAEAEAWPRSRPAARARPQIETPVETPGEEPAAPEDEEPPVMNRQMRRMAKALARKAFRSD